MFVTFTISPLLFIFLICKSQFKLDGISWRRGKSQDSKLFLWFATRQERGGEKQERRNQNLQSLIFRFTVLQMMIHILVPAEALRYFGGKSCWKPFIFWSMCRRPFLVFCLLIFGPKFVVHRAINRGRGGGLLARFILNITICWLFLHLHFYCRIYSDYPACWRKNWGRSKWGGSVPQRATNIVQFIDIKEKSSKVDTGLTLTWSRSEAGSQNILFQDSWRCCLWWQSYDALKHNAHPNVPHDLNKCALYIS